MGRIQEYIYNILVGGGLNFSGIHCAFRDKIGYHSISVFATSPGRYRIGLVDRFEVCYIYRTRTYIHIL